MNKIFFNRERVSRFFLYFILISCAFFLTNAAAAQKRRHSKARTTKFSNKRVIYGIASFYANKFNGRRTASGEIFSQSKLTCACNMLPFGTIVKVTNVKNGKSVIVRVNDRLHTRMRRIADLSKAAARKISAMSSGLVRVKMEVISRKKSSGR